MKKRLLSLLLALALLLSGLPQLSLPTRAENQYSGNCGNNLTWIYDPDTNTLTIEGSGDMDNYEWYQAPWFSFERRINYLVLPDGLTSIGQCAFMSCDFTTVTIPSSVTKICANAFNWCYNLNPVTIPEGVVSIEDYAFAGCDKLLSVTIPASVRYVSGSAFAHCNSFTRFAVAEGNTSFSVDAEGVLYSADGTELVSFPRGLQNNYRISENVRRIGTEAFTGCPLRSVAIPGSVKEIGANAFMDTFLNSVTLPESLTNIDGGAFDSCEDLETVYNYSKSCSISNSENTLGYADTAVLFGYLGSTTESYAREKNYRFVNIESNNSGICGANGGDNLSWYFDTDSGTLEITGTGEMESYYTERTVPWSIYNKQIRTVALPDGITSIGELAFYGCSLLQSITLPESLTFVGRDAFKGCSELNSIVCRNPECQIFSDYVTHDIDTKEDLDYGEAIEFPETLGVSGQTVIYGIHDTDKANSPELEISNRHISDTYSICEYARYAESYAKYFGYTFIPLNAFGDVKPTAYYAVPVAWAVANGITSGTGGGGFSPKKTCTREQVVSFLRKAAGSPEPEATSSPFPDVKPSKYYFKPVLWALERGITSGQSDGRFGVGKACTREQVVSFLWKAVGSPEPEGTENPFTDVKPGKYYYKPVLWAVENGVTSGASASSFGVGKSCTRAQIVTFLYNVYGK